MVFRTAYLLTGDTLSYRAVFSKNILQEVGFHVKMVLYDYHEDKVLSNKYGMMNIYKMIQDSDENFAYVFEDDINVLEPIQLEEIIQYEPFVDLFFYLGFCQRETDAGAVYGGFNINEHEVYIKSGNISGLHAIGISKKGVEKILEFASIDTERYMDVILGKFSRKYPAICLRYDLESSISGHRGIFFQDREKFPTSI